MEQFTLNAQVRGDVGSAAARRSRRAGMVPAVVYGHKQDAVPILLHREDVKRVVSHRIKMVVVDVAGKSEQALVRDVQFDTFGEDALHVDFERVAMDELIEVECPVELAGTSKGQAAGGVVEHPVTDLRVRCLPGNIPEFIRVSISDLAIGDVVHVRDVRPPEGVTILTDPEAILVHIRPPAKAEVKAVAAEAAEAPTEPKVIGREKPEEEPAEEDES